MEVDLARFDKIVFLDELVKNVFSVLMTACFYKTSTPHQLKWLCCDFTQSFEVASIERTQ